MKKKNIFYTAMAVTLLLTAAFLTNCLNPLEEGGGGTVIPGGGGNPINVPEGKAVVYLAAPNARSTILPDVDITELFYTLTGYKDATFTTKDENVSSKINHTAYADLSKIAIVVDADVDYWFKLYGYTLDDSDIIALEGQTEALKPVKTSKGENKTITIDLKGITEGAFTGEFIYDITFPSPAPDKGILVLTKRGAGPSATGANVVFGPIEMTAAEDNKDDPEEIAVGIYNAYITTEADGFKPQIVQWLVYIYPTLTSTLEFTLPKADPGSLAKEDDEPITVILNAISGKGSFNAPLKTEFEKEIFPADTRWDSPDNRTYYLAYDTILASEPVTPIYVGSSDPPLAFDGWYRNPDSLGIPWSFGPAGTGDLLFGDQVLYAKWASAAEVASPKLVITFSLQDFINGAGELVPSSGTLKFSSSLHNKKVDGSGNLDPLGDYETIVVTVPSDISGIKWYLKGTEFNLGVVGNTITFTNNQAGMDAGYIMAGSGVKFTVEGVYNGQPVSLWFTLVFDLSK